MKNMISSITRLMKEKFSLNLGVINKLHIMIIITLLFILALAFPASAAEWGDIVLTEGQTSFSVDIYVDQAEPYAGVEFGIKLSNEDALKFVSFQLSDAVRGASVSPFVTARGTHYFGFYTVSNAWSGRIKAGTLNFTYTGDTAQTITLSDMEVFRITSDNITTGTKKTSPAAAMEVKRIRFAPGGGETSDPGDTGNDELPEISSEKDMSDEAKNDNEVKVKDKSDYFKDVDKKWNWAAGAIDYLYEAGVTEGTVPGRYSPEAKIRRGDFMLMLVRVFGFKAEWTGNFPDVPEESYYYSAVAIAKALGITEGDGVNFNPDSPVTRQDMMVLITKAFRIAGRSLPPGTDADLERFADGSKISDYAHASAAALVKAGIIEGSGKSVNPLNATNRAEVAVVLVKLIKILESPDAD